MLDRTLGLTIVFSLCITLSSGICPMNWTQGLDAEDCLYFNPIGKTWLAAENDCVKRGGHLVSMNSGFKNSLLAQYTNFWMGGTNMYTPGLWQWSDGTNVSYTNWEKGQPQNSNYSLCTLNVNLKWRSQSCNDINPYVCEVKFFDDEQCSYCDQGWTLSTVTNKCYQHFNTNLNFNDSRVFCQQYQADLVSIHSYRENEVVADIANVAEAGWATTIGLKCYGDYNNCFWSDGTAFDYPGMWMVHGNDITRLPNPFVVVIVADRCYAPYLQWNGASDIPWPFMCQKGPNISYKNRRHP